MSRSAGSHETLSIPGPEPKLGAMDFKRRAAPENPGSPVRRGVPPPAVALLAQGDDPLEPPMAYRPTRLRLAGLGPAGPGGRPPGTPAGLQVHATPSRGPGPCW